MRLLTNDECRYAKIAFGIAAASSCKDKKVGAVGVDEDGIVVSVAWNKPCNCNGLCNKTCSAIHAEELLGKAMSYTVYLTNYPCENCQKLMHAHGIEKVVVFGEKHKEDLGLLNIEVLPVFERWGVCAKYADFEAIAEVFAAHKEGENDNT